MTVFSKLATSALTGLAVLGFASSAFAQGPKIQEGSIAEDSPMRGFDEKLSDAEIVASIHYFKSLWPKEILNRHKEMVQH